MTYCIVSADADRYAAALADDEALFEYAAERGISVEEAESEIERLRHEEEMDRAAERAEEFYP